MKLSWLWSRGSAMASSSCPFDSSSECDRSEGSDSYCVYASHLPPYLPDEGRKAPICEFEAVDILSDVDEAEIKWQLLNDRYRKLFDKFDPEGFGEIPWAEFQQALRSPDFAAELERGKIDLLSQKAREKSGHTSAITFQDFVNTISGKRTRSFKCAVHHRDHEICSENDFHLVLEGDKTVSRRMVRLIAREYLTDERDRVFYADHYRCWPPPLFLLIVALLEISMFAYYCSTVSGDVGPSGPVPMDSVFIYRPDRRDEVWRFLTYSMVHAGWLHLAFNLVVMLLVGLPLEMVHGPLRIGTVYASGVLAGSLGTSVFDDRVFLVGGSGGVYALLAAHLANVLLNFSSMQFGVLRLLGIFLIVSADVGFAVYDRYAYHLDGPPVSYVAHLTGALAGLSLGLVVLKNFEQKLHERLLWWLALTVYGVCTLFALLFNLFHEEENFYGVSPTS